jgi:gliding motility-associated-like protein
MYWLQATDENNCAGKDTIMIAAKDCLFGLYVPSAFSPNHDGKNDVFKPLLFGYIKQYRFTIYNRWGQIVFTTTDPARGWDGRNGSYEQNNNIFVWVCMYQLEGEEVKTAKGTVTLVR